ncbi:MAG: GNVR domain-containing protein [Candidatus Marinimicrobia bacterium]|nr:GNVR domain-containing protein [Candidatus Neomarinimicrobiota bacterium]
MNLTQTEYQFEKKPFFKLLNILWMYRKSLVIVNMSIVSLTIIYTLIIPKSYTATAKIIIKKENTGNFDISSQLQNLSMLNFGSSRSEETKRYIALLESVTITDSIINRFNLEKEYKTKYREDTYKTLEKNTSFIDNEDGTISITCTYKENPVKAAEMANYYVTLLEGLDTHLNKKQYKEFREYIEINRNESLEKLKEYEESLREFQNAHYIIDIEKQGEQIVEEVAALENQKILNEIEIRYMGKSYSKDSPLLLDLKNKNKEIQESINGLKESSKYSNLPLDKIPDLAVKYLRIYREVKIQEKVLEFLVVQHENAKVQENKEISNIMVLDHANTPERKSKPQRASIVIITFFFSSFLSIFSVVFIDFIKRNKSELKMVVV